MAKSKSHLTYKNNTNENNQQVCALLYSFSLIFPIFTFAADINQIDSNTQKQIRQQQRQRLLRQQQEFKPDIRDFGEQN